MKYFAYGSNLNQNDLLAWCKRKNQSVPQLSDPRPFRLDGYKLDFTRYSENRKGGVADIVASELEHCWGIVFNVSQVDLDILSIKEGVSSSAYRQLTLTNGMVTYEVANKTKFVQPHIDYVDLIIQGAKNYGLPQDWIKKLESFKVP